MAHGPVRRNLGCLVIIAVLALLTAGIWGAVVLKRRAGERAERRRQQEAFESCLAQAKQAVEGGDWASALKHANSALEITPDSEEAGALKSQATDALVPRLRITAKMNGTEMTKAEVRIDDKRVSKILPFTMGISPHDTYRIDVICRSAGGKVHRSVRTFRSGKRGLAPVALVLKPWAGPLPGQPWSVPELDMEFIAVTTGTFRLGDDPSRKQIDWRGPEVTVPKRFWMGTFEVTRAQFEAFVDQTRYQTTAEKSKTTVVVLPRGRTKRMEGISWRNSTKGDRMPVSCMAIEDGVMFCEWLTKREQAAGRLPDGFIYRLPSEAEWEYCAKTSTPAWYRADIEAHAWVDSNSGYVPHEVGTRKANPWGFHDMVGNASEWCHGVAGFSYGKKPLTDPTPHRRYGLKIRRGGYYFMRKDFCRPSMRVYRLEGDRGYSHAGWYGFRVALAAPYRK